MPHPSHPSLALLLIFIVGIHCASKKRETTGHIPNTAISDSAKAIPNLSDTIQQAYTQKPPIPAAADPSKYLPLFQSKRVGLVVNQTSMVGDQHLVDLLQKEKIALKVIFAPEHGFRGQADAGEHIKNGKDAQSGLPMISLYGKKKAPEAADLADIDVVVFDIQDVGARFYTYLSTLYYVMDACAVHKKQLIILDRPNPNGHYVDGPVLKPDFKSFVGVVPVPIVHGCTLGEMAKMILGEKWLPSRQAPELTVIPCTDYAHISSYHIPVPPSPNLRTDRSILLYPSLCLFEGTVISVGRGTGTPFELIGHPSYQEYSFAFTPKPSPGAKKPLYEGQVCFGRTFEGISIESLHVQKRIDWSIMVDAYQAYKEKNQFFLASGFFDQLAGTDQIRKLIKEGKDEAAIRASYQKELDAYRLIRNKYLLYHE